MTTTPTLYVEATTRTTLDSWGQRVQIVDQRPATHDELIAAMPRCGTCDKREDDGLCTRTMSYVRDHFGCTEHKEHSNGK